MSRNRKLVEAVVDRLVSFLDGIDSSGEPVMRWQDPFDLQTLVRETMMPTDEGHCHEQLRLDTNTENETHSLVKDIEFVLAHTSKSAHKRCLNQLFHKADTVAILADYLTATINTSIYTYEMNPIVSVLELELLKRFHEMLGWDPLTAGGTFPPGGSYSNLYGLLCARTKFFPHVAAQGWKESDRPVFFVSDSAHYSAKKAAALIGMGYNSIVAVESDSHHRMNPEKLRTEIQRARAEGRTPFCVIATLGTTLMGAIDPLPEIGTICQQERTKVKTIDGSDGEEVPIWFHIDGCLGGALIHSPRLKERFCGLTGLESADSIAYNAHKMMGITQQCSVFLTKHKATQIATFATKAAYLFNADKQYDAEEFDVGDRVFQCARRPDCVKLWLTWRYRGDEGMKNYVERAFHHHLLFNQTLTDRDDFVVVSPVFQKGSHDEKAATGVPCTCFWWLPPSERDKGLGSGEIQQLDATSALHRAIDASTARAKLLLMSDLDNPLILTMSRAKSWPNFWRFVANGAHEWSNAQLSELLDDVSGACLRAYSKIQQE